MKGEPKKPGSPSFAYQPHALGSTLGSHPAAQQTVIYQVILYASLGDVDGAHRVIREAYRRVLGRQPSEKELRLGLEFLESGRTDSERQELWREYARALLSSNEFAFLN